MAPDNSQNAFRRGGVSLVILALLKKDDLQGYLYRMAERLAEIRGICVEEVHAVTTQNAKRLYRI